MSSAHGRGAPPDYAFSRSLPDQILLFARYGLFKLATRRSAPLFVRGADHLSAMPQVAGIHEPEVTGLIEALSRTHGDFLLDVGANVGLIACQLAGRFAHYEVVEPNPVVFRVLEANTMMRLGDASLRRHCVALGREDGTLTLTIPRGNFGGAFLHDGNAYDDATLAAKDGFDALDAANYVSTPVEVRAARPFFAEIFARLAAEGRARGVLKLDVEGFEQLVLDSVFAELPADFSLAIVFENWSPDFDPARFGAPTHDVSWLALAPDAPEARRWMGKYLHKLIHGRRRRLTPVAPDLLVGDLLALAAPR